MPIRLAILFLFAFVVVKGCDSAKRARAACPPKRNVQVRVANQQTIVIVRRATTNIRRDNGATLFGADYTQTEFARSVTERTETTEQATVLTAKCAACHSGAKPKGGLDVTKPLDPATIAAIEDRVLSRDPATQMPPPEKPQLATAEILTLLSELKK